MAEEVYKNFETLQLHAGMCRLAPYGRTMILTEVLQVTLQTRRQTPAPYPSTRLLHVIYNSISHHDQS
jgi:hypothetical protein